MGRGEEGRKERGEGREEREERRGGKRGEGREEGGRREGKSWREREEGRKEERREAWEKEVSYVLCLCMQFRPSSLISQCSGGLGMRLAPYHTPERTPGWLGPLVWLR